MLERLRERVTTPWNRSVRIAALAAFACVFIATQADAQTAQNAQNQPAPSDDHGSVANLPRPNAALPPGYQLGSGDHVRITVFGQQELTGEYLVDGTGELSFPLIGHIHAGGLNADQLSRAIEAKLSPDYLKNPHVSCEVLTYRPFYIVGEVKTPGSYAYVSGMTVLNAVALAGGFTYRARENSFYVERNGPDGGKTKLDATQVSPIQPGDIITVRERYF